MNIFFRGRLIDFRIISAVTRCTDVFNNKVYCCSTDKLDVEFYHCDFSGRDHEPLHAIYFG